MWLLVSCCMLLFCSSRRRHTRCALVTGVQTCALPISPFGTPGDREADRHGWTVLHKMRRLDWHQQGLPRHQAHSFTLGQEAVVPLQIAVSAAMEAFALVRGDQRFLAGRKDSHRLFAFDLEQDVMLRVHVERSEERRVGKEGVITGQSRWWQYH